MNDTVFFLILHEITLYIFFKNGKNLLVHYRRIPASRDLEDRYSENTLCRLPLFILGSEVKRLSSTSDNKVVLRPFFLKKAIIKVMLF